MDGQSRQISEMIQSGEYFKRARAWYKTMYIAPIAERSFFLVIAAFASLVALVSFIGVVGLLPLTDRPGIVIRAERINEAIPQLFPLNSSKDQPVNEALVNFFVNAYVQLRETYTEDTYEKFYNFVRAQSDPATFEKYAATYSRENPKSPAAILGSTGKRLVTIRSTNIRRGEPNVATVNFTTEIEGRDSMSRTNWTATLQFYYTDLVVKTEIDPTTGEEVLNTQDPVFQVVDYELTKSY